MKQVLFSIPIQALANVLPDLPPILYLAAGFLVYGLGRFSGKGNLPRVVALGLSLLLMAAGIVKYLAPNTPEIPIYGYGAMLFVAFVGCTWLAGRLALREGIAKVHMQDLGLWIFISGIIGARITYMIQYQVPLWQFPFIWEGGLVFYGSALGGAVGYFLYHFLVLRPLGVSPWKMMDVIAPCVALGLALGRVGCLLNGCCFGNVACPDCPAVSFPFPSEPRRVMTERGYQTDAGFSINDRHPTVIPWVEPHSPAAEAGLRAGDTILEVNGQVLDPARMPAEQQDRVRKAVFGEENQHQFTLTADHAFHFYLGSGWPRGKNDMILTVKHPDGREETLPPFVPRTIGLHPTQIYESISMVLLLFLLLAYYPLKPRDGAVMVLFMLAYAVHRFLNEMLRTDTKPVAFDMTLSQNISILVLTLGIVLGLYLWLGKRPPTPVMTGTV